MIKKIRHLGIVVEDVETAVKKYEGFGLTCSERFEKEEEGMEFAFFRRLKTRSGAIIIRISPLFCLTNNWHTDMAFTQMCRTCTNVHFGRSH